MKKEIKDYAILLFFSFVAVLISYFIPDALHFPIGIGIGIIFASFVRKYDLFPKKEKKQ